MFSNRDIYVFVFYFIYLWLCWVFVAVRAFLWLWEQDYSLVATHGLLIAGASLMVKHRLQVKGFGSCSA